jgi:hypothetical protein
MFSCLSRPTPQKAMEHITLILRLPKAAKPTDGLAGRRIFLRTPRRRLFRRTPDARPELPAPARRSHKSIYAPWLLP